jgi:hypothetical protein
MQQKSLIGVISVIILVLIVLTVLIGRGNIFKTGGPTPTPPPPTLIPTPTPMIGDTIMFTGLKFTPEDLEIRPEMVVNIANFGDDDIEIVAQDSTGEGSKLNLGVIRSGETSGFIQFNTPGVYGYYNKLKPEDPYNKGRVIVK